MRRVCAPASAAGNPRCTYVGQPAPPSSTSRVGNARITSSKGTEYQVTGDLTIKGVTRPVTLDVEYDGLAKDPWGGTRLAVTASTEIDREDWGLGWNVALETGGVLVSKKVKLEIEAQAVLQA